MFVRNFLAGIVVAIVSQRLSYYPLEIPFYSSADEVIEVAAAADKEDYIHAYVRIVDSKGCAAEGERMDCGRYSALHSYTASCTCTMRDLL